MRDPSNQDDRTYADLATEGLHVYFRGCYLPTRDTFDCTFLFFQGLR